MFLQSVLRICLPPMATTAQNARVVKSKHKHHNLWKLTNHRQNNDIKLMTNLESLWDALHKPSTESLVIVYLAPLLFNVTTKFLLCHWLPSLHSLLQQTPQILNRPKISHLGCLEIVWDSAVECQTCLKSFVASETVFLVKKIW